MASNAELSILVALKDQASAGLKGISKESGGLGSALKTLAVAAVAAVGAFATFKTLESIVSTTQDLGASVNKLKREIGGTAEDSSKLLFAFQHLGLSGDDASASLGILAKKLKGVSDEETGVTTGGKTTGDILADLGVKAFTATGELASMGQIMPQIADIFKNMPDGVEKTGLAMQLFGRSGKDMIPVLNKGAEGLHDLGVEAEKFGLVLSEQSLQDVKDYTAAQRDLGAGFEGIKVQLGLAVMPALTDLTALFASSLPTIRAWMEEGIGKIGAYLAEHEEDIRNFGQGVLDLAENGFQRLTEVAPPLLTVLGDLAAMFADVASNLVPLLASSLTTVAGLLQDHPALVYAIIAAYAAFQVGSFVQDLASIVAGLFGVAGAAGVATGSLMTLKAALITTGIGALIVGLATAAYLVYTNWSTIWPELAGFIEAWYARIAPIINAAISVINALGFSIDSLPSSIDIDDSGVEDIGIRFETAAGHAARLAAEAGLAGDVALLLNRGLNATAASAQKAVAPFHDLGSGLGGLTSGAGGAAEAFRGLDDDLAALRRQMRDTATAGLAVLNAEIANEEGYLTSLKGYLEDAQAAHADLEEQIRTSTDAMTEWENAALRGTRAFSDASHGLSQEQDALQLKITNIKIAMMDQAKEMDKTGYASGAVTAMVQKLAQSLGIWDQVNRGGLLTQEEINRVLAAAGVEMDELRLKAEKVDLTKNLTVGDDQYELEKWFEDMGGYAEFTMNQIKAGWTGSSEELTKYLTLLARNEKYMEDVQAGMTLHESILDNLKAAQDELTAALESGINEKVKTAWEARGDIVVKSIDDAFAAMDRGDKDAATAALADAQALFDRIKALTGGTETGLFAGIEKVLADAQGSINVDISGMADQVSGDLAKVGVTVQKSTGDILTTLTGTVAYYLEGIQNRSDIMVDRLVDIQNVLGSVPVAQHGGAVLSGGLVHVEAGETIIPPGRSGGVTNNYYTIAPDFSGAVFLGDAREKRAIVDAILPELKRRVG